MAATYVFSARAPEDWRSPKAVANSGSSVPREASWTAPVLWRFWTGMRYYGAKHMRHLSRRFERILLTAHAVLAFPAALTYDAVAREASGRVAIGDHRVARARAWICIAPRDIVS